MSVQSRKDEILRLIRTVRSADALSPEPGGPAVPRRPPARTRPAPRHAATLADRSNQAEIDQLRRRRQELEERILAGELPRRIQDLEERFAALEARLSVRDRLAALPPGPARVEPPALARPAEGDQETLAGKIAEGVLADILQMLSSNLASGMFVIHCDSGDEFKLSFEEGQIIHATGMALSGDSAFFAALAIDGGRFCFLEGAERPPERTINSKTQFLILEALRQIDEARAGGGEGASHD